MGDEGTPNLGSTCATSAAAIWARATAPCAFVRVDACIAAIAPRPADPDTQRELRAIAVARADDARCKAGGATRGLDWRRGRWTLTARARFDRTATTRHVDAWRMPPIAAHQPPLAVPRCTSCSTCGTGTVRPGWSPAMRTVAPPLRGMGGLAAPSAPVSELTTGTICGQMLQEHKRQGMFPCVRITNRRVGQPPGPRVRNSARANALCARARARGMGMETHTRMVCVSGDGRTLDTAPPTRAFRLRRACDGDRVAPAGARHGSREGRFSSPHPAQPPAALRAPGVTRTSRSTGSGRRSSAASSA